MTKEKLADVLKDTTTEERDAIEGIIINERQASIPRSVNMEKLRRLGLVCFSTDGLFWKYDGGPISEFFEVVQ